MGLAPSLSSSKVWDRDGRGKDLDKIPKRDRIGGRDEKRTDSHNRAVPGAGYSHAQNG